MTRRLVAMLMRSRALVLLLTTVFVLVGTQPRFTSDVNLRALFTTASPPLLVVAGLSVVMICGQIDLSVGSLVALGGMLAMGWQDSLGTVTACVVAVGMGTIIGVLNGVLIGVLQVNAILATLGTMIVINGISLSLAGGGTTSGSDIDASLWIQRSVVWVLSPAALIAIAVVIVLHVVVSQTPWGRNLYIIGGSDDDGRLTGIRSSWSLVTAFSLCGTTASLAGVVLSVGLNTGSPDFGSSILFSVIAAAVIGGVSLFGAEGSVAGGAVGVFALQSVSNGMNLAGVATDIQTMVNGSILLAVVLLDSAFRARGRRTSSPRRAPMAIETHSEKSNAQAPDLAETRS